jgi:hypothetical protein
MSHVKIWKPALTVCLGTFAMRLIPRADFARERASGGRILNGDWEFAEQRGTPYGMARAASCAVPAACPAMHPRGAC